MVKVVNMCWHLDEWRGIACCGSVMRYLRDCALWVGDKVFRKWRCSEGKSDDAVPELVLGCGNS